jgi:outer membrane protein TolC
VRQALLDLETTRKQIDVATNNQEVARQTLELTRQRFDSGIADSVELVQAQESVASSNLDYIDSVFAYNLAKISLARALGNTEQNAMQFLQLQ